MPGSCRDVRPSGKPPMLLTITLTEPPATDLGYLLHKHPDRLQTFPVSAGQAHVFYPEAGGQRCTAALLLEIDPIGLVRGHRRAGSGRAGGLLPRRVRQRPALRGLVDAGRRAGKGLPHRDDWPLRRPPGPGRPRAAAGDQHPGAVLPRRHRSGSPAAPAAGLGCAGRAHPARPGTAGVGRLPVSHGPADRTCPAGRRAQPPVRASAGAGRHQALLGQRRRDRQAAPRGRGLARRAPRAGPDQPPLPGPSAEVRRDRGGTPGRGGRHGA